MERRGDSFVPEHLISRQFFARFPLMGPTRFPELGTTDFVNWDHRRGHQAALQPVPWACVTTAGVRDGDQERYGGPI